MNKSMADQLQHIQQKPTSQAASEALANSKNAVNPADAEEEEDDGPDTAPNSAPNAADAADFSMVHGADEEEDDAAEAAAEDGDVSEEGLLPLVPFAAKLEQEITFVVFPDDLSEAKLAAGLQYNCPFSRNGGLLRGLLANLTEPLLQMAKQNVLLLGTPDSVTASLSPVYQQISSSAIAALFSAEAQADNWKEGDEEEEQAGIPIDDRLYINGGNINLTYFTPYPDLQEDAGVKQIRNLAIWLSKLTQLTESGVKLNIVFAYTVEDLLDSSANLVLQNIASHPTLNPEVYTSRNHEFKFAPELVQELTSTFDAFLVVTLG